MQRNQLTFFSAFIGVLILSGCSGFTPKNTLSTEDQAEYLAKGKKITAFSFKALSSEVIKAIEEGGVKHATEYCQLQASPLIDSLSKTYQADISRVSDKYRNQENKPDELDLKVIEDYRRQLSEGHELQAHLEGKGTQVIYYSPIIILNPLCLQCHGEPGKTMETENAKFIKTKYPEDKATGYTLGELRGVWRVMFNV
jgi:outer membrane murein-binding lipoprotein Lpp